MRTLIKSILHQTGSVSNSVEGNQPGPLSPFCLITSRRCHVCWQHAMHFNVLCFDLLHSCNYHCWRKLPPLLAAKSFISVIVILISTAQIVLQWKKSKHRWYCMARFIIFLHTVYCNWPSINREKRIKV